MVSASISINCGFTNFLFETFPPQLHNNATAINRMYALLQYLLYVSSCFILYLLSFMSTILSNFYYRQLLKILRFRYFERFFFKLLCDLHFFLKSFYFFFNHVARYTQSKESRNLPKKIPQITCKAIFRSCLI